MLGRIVRQQSLLAQPLCLAAYRRALAVQPFGYLRSRICRPQGNKFAEFLVGPTGHGGPRSWRPQRLVPCLPIRVAPFWRLRSRRVGEVRAAREPTRTGQLINASYRVPRFCPVGAGADTAGGEICWGVFSAATSSDTGRHARLGSQLLARLCRGRHLRRQSSTRLQGATLTDPDKILSHHPARAIARRLPPSTERRAPPGEPVGPKSAAMTHLLRSSPITGPSSLIRGSPPLSDASVLSASRWAPLVPFPLASSERFSRSLQEPDRASRCLPRMPLGRYKDILRACPAGRVTPRF